MTSSNGSNNYDGFGDVLAQTQGVFGAEQAALQPGLKRHRTVHAQPAEEGVVLQFECQVCGQPSVITVEYPEVVALKYGVNPVIAFRNHPSMLKEPTRWEFSPSQNGWNPDITCRACNANCKKDVLIEPHEPELMLAGARRRGFINAGGEHQVSAICAKVAQAGQGVRR
jgi:hypothetical protein